MAENSPSGKRKTLYGRYDDYAASEEDSAAGGNRAFGCRICLRRGRGAAAQGDRARKRVRRRARNRIRGPGIGNRAPGSCAS